MTVVLPYPAGDRPDVLTGEVVGRDVMPAGVLEQLPAGAAGALARVPGVALDPFARLVDAFLDEAPPNTARGYRTDLSQWAVWPDFRRPRVDAGLLADVAAGRPSTQRPGT